MPRLPPLPLLLPPPQSEFSPSQHSLPCFTLAPPFPGFQHFCPLSPLPSIPSAFSPCLRLSWLPASHRCCFQKPFFLYAVLTLRPSFPHSFSFSLFSASPDFYSSVLPAPSFLVPPSLCFPEHLSFLPDRAPFSCLHSLRPRSSYPPSPLSHSRCLYSSLSVRFIPDEILPLREAAVIRISYPPISDSGSYLTLSAFFEDT